MWKIFNGELVKKEKHKKGNKKRRNWKWDCQIIEHPCLRMQHERLARDSEQNTHNTCDMHSVIQEEKRRGYAANCHKCIVETTERSVLFNDNLG